MIEVFIAIVMVATGLGVLAPIRGRVPRPAIVFLSFPIGAALYMLVGSALVVFVGSVDPRTALMVAGAAAAFGAITGAFLVPLTRRDLLTAVAAAGIAALVALLAWIFPMARLTPDSLRYLLGAYELRLPDALNEINPADLLARQFGLQALHGLSEWTTRSYVASVGPLFGVFGAGLLGWFTWSRVGGPRGYRTLMVVAVLAFLLGSNRMLYNFFYINTHAAVAVFLFIAAAGAWLAVVDGEARWGLPVGLALAAILLLRPEAPTMAALLLIPVAASRVGWRFRWLMVTPPTVVMALWYGGVLWSHAPDGQALSLTSPVFGNLVVFGGAAAMVLIGGSGSMRVLVTWASRLMVPVLVVALAVYAYGDPSRGVRSAAATVQNVLGHGFWMFTWLVLLALLTVAMFLHRIPDGRLWTTPILAFGVLFWLLPYVREGTYRVGPGDSGNRILGHFFMIVVAFVVLAVSSRDKDEPEVEKTTAS